MIILNVYYGYYKKSVCKYKYYLFVLIILTIIHLWIWF